MAGRAREARLKQARVKRQHGAGHGRHSGGHGGEKRATAHALQIGPDEERRLNHADEDVGGSRGAKRPAYPEGALEEHARSQPPRAAARPSDRAGA